MIRKTVQPGLPHVSISKTAIACDALRLVGGASSLISKGSLVEAPEFCAVAPLERVPASGQPGRVILSRSSAVIQRTCRQDQGGNNVQRAVFAQRRGPLGVWGSDIPRLRRRVLFSG